MEASYAARTKPLNDERTEVYKAVSGHGFRRVFTSEEIKDIERLRAEMRERLTCPNSEYETIVARQDSANQS